MTPTTDHPILRLFAPMNAVGPEGQKRSAPSRVDGGLNVFAGLIAAFGEGDIDAGGKMTGLGDALAIVPDRADIEPGLKVPSTLDQLRLGADVAPQPAPRGVPKDVVGEITTPDPLSDEETTLDQAGMVTPSQIQPQITLPTVALSDLHVQIASQTAAPPAEPETGVVTDTSPKQSAPPATTDAIVAGAVAARAQVASTPVLPSTSDRRGKAQKNGVEQATADASVAASPKAPLEMPVQISSVADSRTSPTINRATPTVEIIVQSNPQATTIADNLAAPKTLVESADPNNLGQGFDAFIQNASNPVANSLATTRDGPQQLGEPAVISTDTPNWEVEFVDSIVAQVSGADAVIEIALSPDNLGQIDVRVEMRDGRADVTFVTETRDAARLFAQAEGRLSDLMQRHGLNLGGQDSSHRQSDQRPFASGRAQAPKTHETTINIRTAPEGRVNLVA